MIKTKEKSNAYEHSLNHALEFFSKAGSLFTKKESFYGSEESALSLFQKSFIVDELTSFKLLLWLRDCRGGSGNRSGFRSCLHWLANHKPEWIECNIEWIPKIGRWDDLRSLFGTSLEKEAVKVWNKAINSGNALAAKWADRSDKPLRNALGLNEANFRKLLSRIRKNHIVEYKMCSKQWNEIVYSTVPSVAMSRYTNAFGRNDGVRFGSYKEGLKSGKEKVNADVLFPHDCVRTVHNGDGIIANAQFDALPNYLEGTDERIIVISDTSGSMQSRISGSVTACDISQGLALYCSAKQPEDSPFYKKFVGFCSEGKFKDWNEYSFSQAVKSRKIFDEAVGSTRIDKALDLILRTAKFFNLPDSYMPTTLLIVSDMQFHSGVGTYDSRSYQFKGDATEVERCMEEWKKAGYTVPKIVYWNTSGYAGDPATCNMKNTALVSGFSPSILKSVLSGADFSPLAIMYRTIEKYEVRIPNGR